MDMMPREPRARIVLAVVLTAAVGGLFLAGGGSDPSAVQVASAPSDQRLVQQQNTLVALAPPPDEVLTFGGRDPFQPRGRNPNKPQPAPGAGGSIPYTPAPFGISSPISPGGVTLPVGGGSPSVPASGDVSNDPPRLIPLPSPPTDPLVSNPDTAGPSVTPPPPPAIDVATQGHDAAPGQIKKAARSGVAAKADAPIGRKSTKKPANTKDVAGRGFQAFQRSREKQTVRPQNRGLHNGWPQAAKWGAQAGSCWPGQGYGLGHAWGPASSCTSSSQPLGARR
jgi:hypothetical protein